MSDGRRLTKALEQAVGAWFHKSDDGALEAPGHAVRSGGCPACYEVVDLSLKVVAIWLQRCVSGAGLEAAMSLHAGDVAEATAARRYLARLAEQVSLEAREEPEAVAQHHRENVELAERWASQQQTRAGAIEEIADFLEDDEPVADVVAVFDTADKHLTEPPPVVADQS